MNEGFFPELIVRVGPAEVTNTVAYSLVVSAILIVFAVLVRLGLKKSFRLAGGSRICGGTSRRNHARNVRTRSPSVYSAGGNLALFIGVANLLGLVPGMVSPTADFSTTAALAVLVFLAVPFYGIWAQGLRGYLRHYSSHRLCCCRWKSLPSFHAR